MKRYPVTSPIHRDGKPYRVGDSIDLDEDAAGELAKSIDKDAGKAVGATGSSKAPAKSASTKKAAGKKTPAKKDTAQKAVKENDDGKAPEGEEAGAKGNGGK